MDLLLSFWNTSITLISTAVIIVFNIFPPKNINVWYGYRTKRSMKGQKSWDFAQKNMAKEALKYQGLVILSHVFLYYYLTSHEYFNLIMTGVWLVCLLISIVNTEAKLKELGLGE